MSRIASKAVVLVLVAAGVSLAACSGGDNPTTEAAARQVTPPYCQRLKDCFPVEYSVAFPTDGADGTTNQCLQKVLDALPNKTAMDACTSAQLTTCTNDIQAAACAASLSATTLPASCQGC